MSFADFKKNSRASIGDLQKKLEETNNKDSYTDDRFWRPELDSASNGYAVIRFLPAVDGEDIPWAKYYSHGFQGKGGWYIENCPTTIGEKCPLCEANNELWNSGLEDDKDTARKRKRRLHYVSNILVVNDPANPQNEGKVFLYKYGKKIFDKIQSAMQPEFPDEEPINPFDFWEGADFRLKVRKEAGFINYDKSEFSSKSALFEGKDEFLEELWKKEYPLSEFTSASNFKSYDELKKRLGYVLGSGGAESTYTSAESISNETVTPPSTESVDNVPSTSDDDTSGETDALSYFEKLAND